MTFQRNDKKKSNLELNHGNGNFEQLIQSDKSNVRKGMMENLNFMLELDLTSFGWHPQSDRPWMTYSG